MKSDKASSSLYRLGYKAGHAAGKSGVLKGLAVKIEKGSQMNLIERVENMMKKQRKFCHKNQNGTVQ